MIGSDPITFIDVVVVDELVALARPPLASDV
jgi:hypothetical protein